MKMIHYTLHALTIIVIIALFVFLKQPAQLETIENRHKLAESAIPDQGHFPLQIQGNAQAPHPHPHSLSIPTTCQWIRTETSA